MFWETGVSTSMIVAWILIARIWVSPCGPDGWSADNIVWCRGCETSECVWRTRLVTAV
ncbi:hypothetical protein SGPA1_80056 [Streptomyces misionensis JCM 4497]